MMRFFMSVNVLLGLAMFIYTLVIEFPVQSERRQSVVLFCLRPHPRHPSPRAPPSRVPPLILLVMSSLAGRGGALLMILSLATLLVSIAMVPIAGVGKKLFIAFIMAVSLVSDSHRIHHGSVAGESQLVMVPPPRYHSPSPAPNTPRPLTPLSCH